MLPESEVPLQRGKESLLDLSQGRIAGNRLPREREMGVDHGFLPHHLAGDIVIAAAVGDAAANHVASVVQDDRLSSGRAEINTDIGP
jgi:hypothetical protein